MTISRITSRAIIEIALFSLVINVLLLIQPLYLLQVYDRVLSSGSMDTLIYISFIALAGMAVLGLLEYVRSVYAARVANQFDAALASNALVASLYGPKAQSGDIQPVQDLATIRNFISSRTIFFLFDLPFAPIFLVLLYFIHPMLFFGTLAGALILVGLMLANEFATRKVSAEHTAGTAETMALAQTYTRNSDTIRALGMPINLAEHWGERLGKTMAVNDGIQNTNSIFSSLSRFVRMGLQLAILGIGAYYVLLGEMTGGMIFAASIISGRALQPMDQIIGAWRNMQPALKALRRVLPVSRIQLGRREGDVVLPAPNGDLTVENLVYALPGTPPSAEPLIKLTNFQLRAGETVGIIGPSGAGKSTLLRLMAGAIRASRGSVAYDKADINQWLDQDRGKHVGYLGQDIEFLPGTIAQNISRFEPGASEDRIIKAALDAGAHDMIVSRPKGYATEVGPSGERLSSGERQRVGLARALFGDPRFLFLDEPDSNLDTDGQAALERALVAAKSAGKTIVIISHRGPLVKLFDRLMVFRGGTMEMLGPTAAVLQKLASLVPQGPAVEPANQQASRVTPVVHAKAPTPSVQAPPDHGETAPGDSPTHASASSRSYQARPFAGSWKTGNVQPLRPVSASASEAEASEGKPVLPSSAKPESAP